MLSDCIQVSFVRTGCEYSRRLGCTVVCSLLSTRSLIVPYLSVTDVTDVQLRRDGEHRRIGHDQHTPMMLW